MRCTRDLYSVDICKQPGFLWSYCKQRRRQDRFMVYFVGKPNVQVCLELCGTKNIMPPGR